MNLPEEMLLWRAVLNRALQDALGYGCNKGETQEARQWFLYDPEASFSHVCAMAGVEPSWIKGKLKAALKRREGRRADRKGGTL